MNNMDGPPLPPEEVRNIIDKLATFVARNGPQFEAITKDKQKDNPKFAFLFGGEWYEYYRSRVHFEEMQMGKIQGPPPMMPPHSEQTFVVKRNQI
jgi:calcium homeostasis ER protein